MFQRTIKQSIKAKGVCLHTGHYAHMCLRPAPVNTGIVFRRTDITPPYEIKVSAEAVTDTNLCTVVGEQHGISTIEHLMSALAGLGIDNLYIDIDTDELPIIDGSSAYYVFLLQATGIVQQDAYKKFVLIKECVECKDEETGAWAVFEPYNGLSLSFRINFNHKAFSNTSNEITLEFSTTSYLKEISRARTFGFMDDLDKLRVNKRALGANDTNAIGIASTGTIVNKEGLRNRDEFVRHKMLDAIGDLYMLGMPVIGSFKAFKSGHKLNNALIRKLMENTSAYEIVEYRDRKCPIKFNFR